MLTTKAIAQPRMDRNLFDLGCSGEGELDIN